MSKGISKSKKVIFIGIGVLLIVGMIVLCCLLLSGKKDNEAGEMGDNASPTPDISSEVTPSVSDTPEDDNTPENENPSEDDDHENPPNTPTGAPSDNPLDEPTPLPSVIPTNTPTNEPANTPTVSPTKAPTKAPTKPTSGTPVSKHGSLSVKSAKLYDSKGKVLQLKGVSTHGIQWFPQYVNKATFQTLRDDWGANVVRLAMYTSEDGYCVSNDTKKNQLKKVVTDGVSYATELGLYVIIDWHVLNDRDPNLYKDQAIDFFKEMAQKYKDYDNVIYEICNEPNGGVTWSQIKTYATDVIKTIRQYDKDAIIIVGTPNWSQYVDQAAASPLTGDLGKNVMYALHFYANTHKNDLRGTLTKAAEAGLPLFVSEFGIGSADGNGMVNEEEANKWIALLDHYDISYVCWNLANKNEASSLFLPSCNKLYGFTENDLSAQGKWLVKLLKGTLDGLGDVDIDEVIQDSVQSGGGGTPQAVPDPIQFTKKDDNYTIQIYSGNTWISEGKPYYGLSLSISNPSKKDIRDWKLTITFNDSVSTSDFWCSTVKVSGKTMTITPESWNSVISVGASVGDIGMNLSGNSELKILSATLTYE